MAHTDDIRRTWALAMVQQDALARRFYTQLFKDAPQTRPLFQSDLDVQGAKLVETLNFIVDHLDAPDQLLPAARDLAMRHVSYGVRPVHYDAVGAALIATLDGLLGDAFDDPARAAWADAYSGLCAHMIAEAYPGWGAPS